VKLDFERRGSLYVPRRDVIPGRRYDRYRQRFRSAIAFVAGADLGNNSGSSNSLTSSFAGGTGSNLIDLYGIVGDAFGGHDDITSVKLNGTSATFVDKIVSGTTSPNRFVYLYVLVNPTSGTSNLVVQCTNSHYILAGAVRYSGAKQSSQPDAHNPSLSSAASNSYASSLTTSANNAWVVCFAGGYDGGNMPGAGTGSTRRCFEGAFGTWGFFDSNSAITPAGSYSMTTTYTNVTNPIVHLMASIAPFGGTAFNQSLSASMALFS
jgi:hypothetical protein